VGAEIFTNFWCFVYDFGYRYARKSFKGSKDANFSLVSKKNLETKEWPNGLRPRAGQRWPQKSKNTPTCDGPPRDHQTEKFFFSILTSRLAESVEGLNSSLALAAGDSWPKHCEPIYWLTRLLKNTL